MQAGISEAERAYVAAGVAQGLRNDGRAPRDLRPLELELGVVARATGSARARAGATDVIAAVRAELLPPAPGAAPDAGDVKATVEISSCASPEFRGRAGEDWGIDLAAALQAALRASLDLRALCVLPGRAAWVLNVDCLVLNDGGGALGALSAAARAALAAARLPKVEVTMGEGGDDEPPEIEIGDEEDGAPVDAGPVPVIVTVAQIGARCVADPTSDEEQCASALLHVAVDRKGQLRGATKAGAGAVTHASLNEMLETARDAAPRLAAALDRFAVGGGGGRGG